MRSWACPALPPAGEIHELKQELVAVDKSKKKDAVKKVIAAMTVGKDVSPLFPGGCNAVDGCSAAQCRAVPCRTRMKAVLD